MVMQRHPLVEIEHSDASLCGSIVLNPSRLDDLFRLGVFVPQKLQSLLEACPILPYNVVLPLKKSAVNYSFFQNDSLFVRLPHTLEEQRYMRGLKEAEFWEESPEELACQIVENEGRLGITGGTKDERAQGISTLKKFTRTPSSFEKIASLLGSTIGNIKTPLPLFRASYVFPSTISKQQFFEDILERARVNYIARNESKKVNNTTVILSTLSDYVAVTEEHAEGLVKQLYENAAKQLLVSSASIMKASRILFGYQLHERFSGIDIVTGIVNRIGQEALPYSMYLLGGIVGAPYRIREYFSSIYPGINTQFVGISSPGAELSKEDYQAIKDDIVAKRPDFLFVSLGSVEQDSILQRLANDGVVFGIGFTLGQSFDRMLSTQKHYEEQIDLKTVLLQKIFKS